MRNQGKRGKLRAPEADTKYYSRSLLSLDLWEKVGDFSKRTGRSRAEIQRIALDLLTLRKLVAYRITDEKA